jgi:YidC/Oxa1 family membrane protein insertase
MNGRRLWTVLLLAGVVMMGISWYVHEARRAGAADANALGDANRIAADANRAPRASTGPATPPSATAAAPAGAEAVPAPGAAPVPAPAPAPARTLRPRWQQEAQGPVQHFALGSLEPDSNYAFQLDVTTEGAAIETLKLTQYFATVADKRLSAQYPHDHARYEKEAAAHPSLYGGNYSLLNPVQSEGNRYLPYAARRIRIWTPGASEPVSWPLAGRQWKLLEAPATGSDGTQQLRLGWTLYHDPNFADAEGPLKAEPLLTVVKTYAVRKADYSVAMTLEVRNESNLPLKVEIEQYGPAGIPQDDPPPDMREVVIGKLKAGAADPYVIFRPRPDLASMTVGEGVDVGYSQEAEGRRMLWIGQVNKYFGSMMYPQIGGAAGPRQDANSLGWPDGRLQFSVAAAMESPQSRAYLTCVTIGKTQADGRTADAPLELAPQEHASAHFDVFAGPKKRELFADVPLYKRLDYLDTIQFRSSCTWSWLVLAMIWLLQVLSYVAMGNYGVAIILLVILVRLAMHPLTKKGQVMMSKTQKMGPAMEKLKTKYADDKDALQKEMMQLYKQQGFTPLLGCLPMALQLPIWAALWGALSAAVELRHAAFLPFWLTDLSAPDAIYHFPFEVPLLHIQVLNLLPLLGCVSTFIQMKYTPQGAPATTPDQKRQQAMMRYMMPVMMTFMFYSMPSGLNLYIMASGLFAAAEQFVIRRHIAQQEALQAATTTTVAMPGKGPRGSRVKKAKGPYWTKRG